MPSPLFTTIRHLFFVSLTAVIGLPVAASELGEPLENKLEDCSFSGSFLQSKEMDGLTRPLLSSGVLYHNCEYGVIWKTIEPITQSLVLLKDGQNYLVDEQGIKKLKGRRSRMLGDIIKAFIGDDFDKLSKHFEIIRDEAHNNANGTQNVVLLPKRKQLKRAFERVSITTVKQQSQVIKMIDKKGMTTTITAIKNPSKIATSECATIENIMASECELLQENSELK